MAEKPGGTKKGEQLSQEKIVATFQQLRQEQRSIANKISELEAEKREHNLVIDTLKSTDPDRKCFRMVGGVLVERTVKDVLPALEYNYQQLTGVVDKLMEQLQQKGKELNEFRQKHNIQMKEERDSAKTHSDSRDKTGASQGVLVS